MSLSLSLSLSRRPSKPAHDDDEGVRLCCANEPGRIGFCINDSESPEADTDRRMTLWDCLPPVRAIHASKRAKKGSTAGSTRLGECGRPFCVSVCPVPCARAAYDDRMK